MVRYLALLLVLSIVLSGCVVVHSEKHMTVTCTEPEVKTSAAVAPSTALVQVQENAGIE